MRKAILEYLIGLFQALMCSQAQLENKKKESPNSPRNPSGQSQYENQKSTLSNSKKCS